MNPGGASSTEGAVGGPVVARRPKRFFVVLASLLALAALAMGIHFIREEFQARSQRRQAEEAIARHDFVAALEHLKRCRDIWTSSGEIAFLQARTARRAGELDAAERFLAECKRLGWSESDLALESALMIAQRGRFATVEMYLMNLVQTGHRDAYLIAEIVAPYFVMVHNGLMAAELLDVWIQREPTYYFPHLLKGELLQRLNQRDGAYASMAEAYRLAPDDAYVREKYALLLADTRHYAEAKEHLEWLENHDKSSVNSRLNLALCRGMLGEENAARTLLEALMLEAPEDVRIPALSGQLDLEAGHPDRAEKWLRQAFELEANDGMICHNYARCLEQLRKPTEAAVVRDRIKQIDASLKRMDELMRLIARNPYDPEPRREAGAIMLRNGQDVAGLRWLDTALAQDPDYAPTHQVLADYYQRKGNAARAEFHRQRAKSSP